MMRRVRPKQRKEPTIALINVVFLMLIFFMVAGTLAPPLDRSLALVNTATLEGRAPADSLVIRADGSLLHRGAPVSDVADFLESQPEDARQTIRVVPDRALPAARLLEVSQNLRARGAERIMIVTERALQ